MNHRLDGLGMLRKFAAQLKQQVKLAREDIKDDLGLQVFMIWAILTLLTLVGVGIYEEKRFQIESEKLEQDFDELIRQRRSCECKPSNNVINWYSAQQNLGKNH